MAEYEHILDVVQSMAKVMERTPKAFENLDEEALRTHFLIPLNSHYQGDVTGETFNFQGKTDILIRSKDKNIFIAECKFWTGPKGFHDTIDQLLDYLSWRDSKTAILLFNRNKDFQKVIDAIDPTAKAHLLFKKSLGRIGETGFKYVFRNKEDAAKEVFVSVLAFNIPRT